MKIIINTALLLAACAYSSCRPKPLDIEVKQKPSQPVISSAMLNGSSVLIGASYSFNSLRSIDSVKNRAEIPEDLLLKNVTITLTRDGQQPDTLRSLSKGIYGNSRELQMQDGGMYTLSIYDSKGTLMSTARSPYFNLPQGTIQPRVTKELTDTAVYLDIKLDDVAADAYYFVSYSTQKDKPMPVDREDILTSLASFNPQQLQLLSGADIRNGKIDKTVRTAAKAGDTLLVHCCRIEKAYYNYLDAYKKAGSFINQLTGEPINLPTNVVKGLGFFALSVPARKVHYLKDNAEYWRN